MTLEQSQWQSLICGLALNVHRTIEETGKGNNYNRAMSCLRSAFELMPKIYSKENALHILFYISRYAHTDNWLPWYSEVIAIAKQ